MHIGEREALNKEKELLLNGSKVMKALGGAYAALGGESGVAVGAEECAALLESAAKFYPEAEEAAKTMRGLAYELSDCAAGVRDLAEGFEYNPERLSQIDERLDALYRISMKYGAREEDILAKLESLKKERAEIEISGELIASLSRSCMRCRIRSKFSPPD